MNDELNANEKKIFKIINEYRKISFNQLKKIVVPEICADQTFQKSLKNMVEIGKIIRCPTEVTQHIFYYADEDMYNLEKRVEKTIDDLILFLDNKFKTFKEEYVKLSEDNRISLFASLCMLMFCIKMKIATIGWVMHVEDFPNYKIKTQSDHVNQLSDKIMEFIMVQDDHFKILDSVDTRYGLLVSDLENEIDKIYTSLHKDDKTL